MTMSRRDFIKKVGMSTLGLALAVSGCGSDATAKPADAAASQVKTAATAAAGGKRVLVAYFSWSGNTRALANTIHQKVGGDIVEIVPEKAYPQEYQATVDQAKAEQQQNARPAITTKVDLSQYDVVMLGYPNWWGSMPMPVHTFISENNWQGKTVLPFFTHGGGGVQRCYSDLQAAITGASFGEYLCLSGGSAANAGSQVDSWLSNNNL